MCTGTNVVMMPKKHHCQRKYADWRRLSASTTRHSYIWSTKALILADRAFFNSSIMALAAVSLRDLYVESLIGPLPTVWS